MVGVIYQMLEQSHRQGVLMKKLKKSRVLVYYYCFKKYLNAPHFRLHIF